MAQMSIADALAEAAAGLVTATWTRDKHGPQGAIFYRGESTTGWTYIVASFDIEPQGFPPGTRGHDGTARRGGVILRLTRELAEKAFRLAEGQPDKED